MGTDDPTTITRRLYDEVMTQGHLEAIDELVADDFVDHEELPGASPDKAGIRDYMATMRTAFPDIQATIDDLITSGDRTVARAHISGTHRGEFMGIAPTGKHVDVETIDILEFHDGKLTEHWGVTDTMAMLQQLGAIESPIPA